MKAFLITFAILAVIGFGLLCWLFCRAIPRKDDYEP